MFNLRARAMRDVSLAALTQSAVTAFMAAMLPRTSSGSGCATSVLTLPSIRMRNDDRLQARPNPAPQTRFRFGVTLAGMRAMRCCHLHTALACCDQAADSVRPRTSATSLTSSS